MKTTDYLIDLFSTISDFWNGFWVGFFEGDSAFVDYSNHGHYLHVLEKYRLRETLTRPDISSTPNRLSLPKLPVTHFPNQAYTRIGSRDQTATVPKPDYPVTPATPMKKHRPDIEYLYHCTIDVEFLFLEPRFVTLLFDLQLDPYLDLKVDERFYSYTFLEGERPFRFYLANGSACFLHGSSDMPGQAFILTSITETVKVSENKEPAFVVVYTIRDSKRKERKFNATSPLQHGVFEALEFFFRLQYYDNWEEFDEMHELCPTLRLRARDIHNQLRRDLCEVGMKLG